jgi:hypothetical protein
MSVGAIVGLVEMLVAALVSLILYGAFRAPRTNAMLEPPRVRPIAQALVEPPYRTQAEVEKVCSFCGAKWKTP